MTVGAVEVVAAGEDSGGGATEACRSPPWVACNWVEAAGTRNHLAQFPDSAGGEDHQDGLLFHDASDARGLASGHRRSMMKYATFVIGMMQLGAIRPDTPVSSQENLGRDQHAQRWRKDIDPKGVPVVGVKC